MKRLQIIIIKVEIMFRSFAACALLAVTQASQLPEIYDSPHLHPSMEIFTPYSTADSSPVNAVSYPGDRCCVFYDGHNYEGGSFRACLPEGHTSTSGDVPSSHMGQISSWYCGKDIKYDICFGNRDNNCRGSHGQHGAGNAMSP